MCGMTNPLINGDPCPCCGQPIQTDDPVMLVALTYIAELLGAVRPGDATTDRKGGFESRPVAGAAGQE